MAIPTKAGRTPDEQRAFNAAYMRRKRREAGALPVPETAEQAIEQNTCPVTETGCTLWTGDVNANGYGRISFKKRAYLAHRFVWEHVNGPIPPNVLVCHKCDTPLCVNPDHLFLGTQQDNLADMVSKGRHIRGSRHPLSKLNPDAVRAIRASSDPHPVAAETFGVSRALIRKVRNRSAWSHVE